MTHAPPGDDDTADTSAMPSPGPIEFDGHMGGDGQHQAQQQQRESEASYTCRRCRTELFTEGHLEPHAMGAQAIARRKKVKCRCVCACVCVCTAGIDRLAGQSIMAHHPIIPSSHPPHHTYTHRAIWAPTVAAPPSS